MKIKELIKELKKHNQEATVILTVGDDNRDIYSSSEFDVVSDKESVYCDLFMHTNARQQL